MPREYKILIIIAIGALVLGWLLFQFGSQKPTAKPLVDRPGVYSKGIASAPIVLTEFADFQCPACRNAYLITDKILADYPQNVRLVFRHFPLVSIHPRAEAAALAAEAAGAQGKFWEMHDLLYAQQAEWGDITLNLSNDQVANLFKEYATQIGLDVTKFLADLNKQTFRDIIRTDANAAAAAGANSTPSFFVNGRLVRQSSYEAVKKAIDEELNK